MEKIIFFGGAFDPIHIGHFQIAKQVYQLINPDHFYFVPLSISVHKAQPFFDVKARLEFLKKSLATEPNFEIYLEEIERKGASYTVDTLQRFLDSYDIAERPQLYYIIGSDEYYNLKSWAQPLKILEMTNFIVINRPGYELKDDISVKVGNSEQFIFVKNVHFDISSSKLRGYLQQAEWDKIDKDIPFSINLLKENMPK